MLKGGKDMKKLFKLVLALIVAITLTLTVLPAGITASAGNLPEYVVTIESDVDGHVSEGFEIMSEENASKNCVLGSMSKGSTYTMRFYGSGIAVYGDRLPEGGSFDVYIDNEKKASVDAAGNSFLARQLLCRINGLEIDYHDIKIVVSSEDKWVAIDYFEVETSKQTFNKYCNLAKAGSVITSVPYPTGGGAKDLDAIKSEVVYKGGIIGGYNSNTAAVYDSYSGALSNEFYIGYAFKEELYFSKVAFQEGGVFNNGGWFCENPKIQVRKNGVWKDVVMTGDPGYNASAEGDGVGFDIFIFKFEKVDGDAIRIIGNPGGTAKFVSVAGLEVYGEADTLSYCEGAKYTDAPRYVEHVHEYDSSVIQPTCSEKGYTLHTCKTCGKTFKDNYTDVVGHSFGDFTVTLEPTCTADGTETAKCKWCDQTESRTVKALGHDEHVLDAVQPTCTESGLTQGVKCARCGIIITEQKIIPAKGHDFEFKETVAPSPDADGYDLYVCKNDSTHVEKRNITEYVAPEQSKGCESCGAEALLLIPFAFVALMIKKFAAA